MSKCPRRCRARRRTPGSAAQDRHPVPEPGHAAMRDPNLGKKASKLMNINRRLLNERRTAMATRQRSSTTKKKGRKVMHTRRKAKKSMPKEPMQEEYPSE